MRLRLLFLSLLVVSSTVANAHAGGGEHISARQADVPVLTLTVSSPTLRHNSSVLIGKARTSGPTCEQIFAVLHNLFAELSNDPSSRGYILIYQPPESRTAAKAKEKRIRSTIKFRNFDPTRIEIVIAGVRKEATVQLWKVESDGVSPEPLPGDAEFAELPPEHRTSPFIFGADRMRDVIGCSNEYFDLDEYAAFLVSKKQARGRVLIAETSKVIFRQWEREVREKLLKGGLPVARFSIIFKRVRANRKEEFTELWIIPAATAPLTKRPLVQIGAITLKLPNSGEQKHPLGLAAGLDSPRPDHQDVMLCTLPPLMASNGIRFQ